MKSTISALLAFIAVIPTSAVSAQNQGSPMMSDAVTDMLRFPTNSATTDTYWADRGDLTPTTKRGRIAKAIALREEAWNLAAADGGTLTARHQRYLRMKSNEILGFWR